MLYLGLRWVENESPDDDSKNGKKAGFRNRFRNPGQHVESNLGDGRHDDPDCDDERNLDVLKFKMKHFELFVILMVVVIVMTNFSKQVSSLISGGSVGESYGFSCGTWRIIIVGHWNFCFKIKIGRSWIFIFIIIFISTIEVH